MELKQKQLPGTPSTITSISNELSSEKSKMAVTDTNTSVTKETHEISQKNDKKFDINDEIPTSSKYLDVNYKIFEPNVQLHDLDRIIDKKRKMESKESEIDEANEKVLKELKIVEEQEILKHLKKLQSSYIDLDKKSGLDLVKSTDKEQNAKIKDNLKKKFGYEAAPGTSKDITSNDKKFDGIFRSKSKLDVNKDRVSLDEGRKG